MSSSNEEAPERRLVCRVMSQFALRGFAVVDNAKLAEAKNRLLSEDAIRNPLAEQLESESDRLLRAFLEHRWPEQGLQHDEEEGDENEDGSPESHESREDGNAATDQEGSEDHEELFDVGDILEVPVYFAIESEDDDEDDLPVPSSNPDTDCSEDEDPLRDIPRRQVNEGDVRQNNNDTE